MALNTEKSVSTWHLEQYYTSQVHEEDNSENNENSSNENLDYK